MSKSQCKDILYVIKRAWKIITWDWASLLLFEVVYKLFLLVLFGYGQDYLLYYLNIAGIEYLTNQNLFQIFRNPLSVLGLMILFILLLYLSFVEISAVVLYCKYAAENRKIGAARLFIQGCKRAAAVFRPKNLGMMILVILMLPLTGITVMSGPVNSFRIPGFILEFIYGNRLLSLFYFCLIMLLMFLLLNWAFCIHIFILEKCSFQEAVVKSRCLIKGRRAKTFFYLAVGMLLPYFTGTVIKFLAVICLLLWTKLTNQPEAAINFWFLYHNLAAIGRILFLVLKTVSLHGVILVVYYWYQKNEVLAVRRKRTWKQYSVRLFMVIAAYGMIVIYTELLNPRQNEIIYFEPHDIEIVAHRAGAAFAPENTIAALKEAVRSGADTAEIDVQQTKDNVLVVMHDTDFKRTAGVDKKVWDVTYEEALGYDMGGCLKLGFHGERLPTLEEMILEADGKIRLMIELKSSGHENKLVEKTIELIHKYSFQSQCTIASLDYAILERVKELDPNVETVYIAAIAYGNMEQMKAADAFSIEETFINSQMLLQAHGLGKKVYAWTVNNEKQLIKMMERKVDGIVTDNPYYTSYILDTKGRSIWVMELVEWILGNRSGSGEN